MSRVPGPRAPLRRGGPVLLPLLVLAGSALWTAPAADAEGPVDVLVAAAPLDGKANERLGRVVLRGVALELQRQGIRSSPVDLPDLWAGRSPELAEAEAAKRVAQAARDSGACRIVAVRYSLTGGRLGLRLSVLDAAEGALIGQADISGPLGLEMDGLIAEGVRQLGDWGPPPLPAARRAPAPAPVAEATSAPPASAAPLAPAAPAPATTTRVATEARAEGAPARTPEPEPAVDGLPSRADAGIRFPVRAPSGAPAVGYPAAPRVRRVELEAGAAPFLTLGRASGYFPAGVAVLLSASYRLPALADRLSLGLRLGANRFDAAGVATESRNLLAPFALEARLHLGDEEAASAVLAVSGGLALFAVTPRGAATLLKTVPCLHAGFGIDLRLSGSAAMGLDAGCQFFLERSRVIAGFVPSAKLRVRV